MPLKILYESDTLLVVDKPPHLAVEDVAAEVGFRPAHRLDKDTSGVLVLAKDAGALEFIQKQFRERKVEKRYICLVEGLVKEDSGTIHVLLGRSAADRRKQRAYPLFQTGPGRREAIADWRVLKRFRRYTLLEVMPKTGRKHQIRALMVFLHHPIAGDRLYRFKHQHTPAGLQRQFLHASYLKIGDLEFTSKLPEDLKKVLSNL